MRLVRGRSTRPSAPVCGARRSGGAFVVKPRIFVVPRASRLDLGDFQHAQAEQQIPHQSRMTGMQAGREDKTGCSRTGTAGSAGLRTLAVFPVRGRQTQQPVNPVRRTHSLFAGTKNHKCFFRCHCRSLCCCAESCASRLWKAALAQGWPGRLPLCAGEIVIDCNAHNTSGLAPKSEQSPCHICRTFEINALPEAGQFFCARHAPRAGNLRHPCPVPVHHGTMATTQTESTGQKFNDISRASL